MSTQGKVIECRAAILYELNSELKVEDVEVHPPRAGEVRIKMVANSLCKSDAHWVTGHPGARINYKLPLILGHEGGGIVESIGDDVQTIAPGDHVVVTFLPNCNQCNFCLNPNTNLCLKRKIDEDSLPDGTTRIYRQGKPVYIFCGTGTLAEYAVISESRVAKINKEAPLNKVCLFGCGITTGYGAATKVANIQPGDTVAIWGLGTIGLAAVIGAKERGAAKIIGIDTISAKKEFGLKLGLTDFINPIDCKEKSVAETIAALTDGLGVNYSIECVGTSTTINQAFDSTSVGYGKAIVVGVSPEGHTFSTVPTNFLAGKTITGCFLGGYKGRNAIPDLVERYMSGNFSQLELFLTEEIKIDQINYGFESLVAGRALRVVVAF